MDNENDGLLQRRKEVVDIETEFGSWMIAQSRYTRLQKSRANNKTNGPNGQSIQSKTGFRKLAAPVSFVGPFS